MVNTFLLPNSLALSLTLCLSLSNTLSLSLSLPHPPHFLTEVCNAHLKNDILVAIAVSVAKGIGAVSGRGTG